MTSTRQFHGISVLIPSYSVEDLPSDLSEARATGLLNAAACAWHPVVIAAAEALPEFRYADISEIVNSSQVLFVPECSEDWLGHDWKQRIDDGNCCLIHGAIERSEWLRAIDDVGLTEADMPSESVVGDFLSLGIAHLFLSVLSRRLHHYISPDATRLTKAVTAAATAALAGDHSACRDFLRDAFECLLETREQLYPVNLSLVDLCLPGDIDKSEQLLQTIVSATDLNLLISPAELRQLAERQPELPAALQQAIDARRCTVVHGGYDELRPSLSTPSAFYADYLRAADQSVATTGKRIWGQQRFGLFHSLPAFLKHFGYDFALHFALDEGLYPEREVGSFVWVGPDDSTMNATSRLPVAISGATAFLRMPERMAETIQEDSTALLILARLPAISSPWLEDLRRIQSFAPVLGRFVTLEQFVETLDVASTRVQFTAGEYLPTHLIQSSVLHTEAPVSGPAGLYNAWHAIDRTAFLDAMEQVLAPVAKSTSDLVEFEQRLLAEEAHRVNEMGAANLEAQAENLAQIRVDLEAAALTTTRRILENLSAGTLSGTTVLNTLPFARDCAVVWPSDRAHPAASDAIGGVYDQDGKTILDVRLPPGGFVQLPESTGSKSAGKGHKSGLALAEQGLLRNQYFEVLMSESTGGIAEVRMHNQRGNRMSQQVAFRYESKRTIPATENSDQQTVHYARTRCEQSGVLKTGPWTGAVESHCVVEDAVDHTPLFRFRQVTRVERTRPRITINIEIQDTDFCVSGNPWMTYVACRFAWDNESAAVSRSVLGQTCGFRGERFESPDFVEVADDSQRLLIIPHGRPYHRRSGNRMLDSLLIVEGEPQREFTFTMEFDQPWPMRTVLDLLHPPVETIDSRVGAAMGWILGVSSKNVRVMRVRRSTRVVESSDEPAPSLVLTLQETEGQRTACAVRTARSATSACLRRSDGRLIDSLVLNDSGVSVEFRPFEIKEVELTF